MILVERGETVKNSMMSAMTSLLGGLLIGAAAAGPVVSAVTHEAPKGGWLGSPSQVQAALDARPAEVPQWTSADAENFPACTPDRHPSDVPDRLVAVTLDGERTTMTIVEAAEIVEGADFPALWVVGFCYLP